MTTERSSLRDLIALGVIASACVGGFVGVVSVPLSESLSRARSALSAVSADPSRSPLGHEAETLARRGRRLSAWADEQASAGPDARYAALLRLAETLGVRVDRIDPIPPRAGREPGVVTFGFAMDATGTYEDVARLLDGVERRLGAAGAARFSLMPAPRPGEPDQVRVALETVHVQLTPTATLARTGAEDQE